MHEVRGGKTKNFLQDCMICDTVTDCRRDLENVAQIAKFLLRSFRRKTKATKKEKEGALSGGSLAPIAPVDSRNIFTRLTEPLRQQLLVRPINV